MTTAWKNDSFISLNFQDRNMSFVLKKSEDWQVSSRVKKKSWTA